MATVKDQPDVLVAGGGNATDGLMGMLTKLLPGIGLTAFLSRRMPAAPEKHAESQSA